MENASGKDGVGALTEYDVNVLELKIVNSFGSFVDLDFLYNEINIYEDIFGNVIQGDMLISDSQNIVSRLQLHGNEFLSIYFKSPTLEDYKKVFRVYKISDYSLRSGTSNVQYRLFFCSEEFFINQQYYVSQSFKEQTLSDVVKIIARQYLKIPTTKFPDSAVEQSTKLNSPERTPLIIPGMKPLEAINWVSSFALNNLDYSPGFFFYENRLGFNFRSFDTLYTQNIKRKLIFSPKNTTDNSIVLKHDQVDNMEFKNIFNMLEHVNQGSFHSNVIKIDYLNREIENSDFRLSRERLRTLNGNYPYNLSQNRFGDAVDQASTYIRMFPKFQGDLVNKWLLVRAARIALLNSMKLRVDLPGDSGLSIGQLVAIDIPENTAETDAQSVRPDRMLSGVYMITGLRHRIVRNKYTCHAELCKDSVMFNLSAAPPKNSFWNAVTNS